MRAALGLGSRPVVGTFGFLLPHKGTLELVKALDPLRAEFPDLLLLALCARYPHVESKEYEEQIRAEIAARGMEDSVLLVTEYLSDDVGPDPAAGHRRDRAPVPGDRRVVERRPAVHPAAGPAGRGHRRPHLHRLPGRPPGRRR